MKDEIRFGTFIKAKYARKRKAGYIPILPLRETLQRQRKGPGGRVRGRKKQSKRELRKEEGKQGDGR